MSQWADQEGDRPTRDEFDLGVERGPDFASADEPTPDFSYPAIDNGPAPSHAAPVSGEAPFAAAQAYSGYPDAPQSQQAMATPAPSSQQPWQPQPWAGQPQWNGQPYPGQWQPGYAQPTPMGYFWMPNVPMRPRMGFGQAIRALFLNYFRFDGRAGRSEFWWAYLCYYLFLFGIPLLTVIMSEALGASFLPVEAIMTFWGVGLLALFIPIWTLTVRRLHDSNKSGWMLLLGMVPFGSVIVLVFLASASDPLGAIYDGPKQPAV